MRRIGGWRLAALCLPALVWPQAATYPLIVTVAGNGQAAYGGDGGQALQAALRNPYAVALDREGNLFIADSDNQRVRKVTPGGVITTVAGTGVKGYGGDRGQATSAQLADPTGLAVDAADNIYIADSSNHRIRRVAPNGVITTVAGTGVAGYGGDQVQAVAAQLADPLNVAVDAAGSIYISDYSNRRVRKVTAAGIISTVAGTGVAGYGGDGGQATAAQLGGPWGVAVDAAGNIYVSDYENHRVRRVGTDNLIRTVAGSGVAGFQGDGGAAAAAQLQYPGGLAVDAAGALYIADRGNDSVRKVTPAGVITTVAGRAWSGFSGDGGLAVQARLATPSAVAVTSAGDLYIADTDNQRIRRVIASAAGGPLTLVTASPLPGWTAGSAYSTTLAAAGGAPPYQWSLASGELPAGLALDGASSRIAGTPSAAGGFTFGLRVTDRAGAAAAKAFVVTFSARAETGIITTVAGSGATGFGGDGGPAEAARLNRPAALALDGEGNLFIADHLNHRIRKVSRAGVISTYAGTGQRGFGGDGGAATAAQFHQPEGLATDAQGNLFVADAGNHRIRKIDRAGVIMTVAGTGTPGFSGDGGPATAAQLNWPVGLALDGAGSLYVGDWLNARVRKVSAQGVITTVAGTGSPGFAGDGGAATVAQFYGPGGLAVDAAGNLYMPDYYNHRVRRISAAGVISTIAGNGSLGFGGEAGPAAAAALAYPCAAAVDAAGNLYLADRDNHRVRKVTPSGVIVTVAGAGVPGFNGDGGPAASAQLDAPMDVALDGEGNLYIAEAGGERVRKVTLASAPAPDAPRITPAGIVNAASLQAGPIAPGEILTLFGVNLGPQVLAGARWDESGRLATTLAGVQVLFDGVPAPLLYVQQQRAGLIVPYAVAWAAEALVQVRNGAVAGDAIRMPVAASAPGIFTLDYSGTGPGAILNQDYSINSAGDPAEIGSVVMIYATGEGQTEPAGTDGGLAAGALPRPRLPVAVKIGGLDAEVLYAGGAPGAVAGLFQVNARVPAGAPRGASVPVLLTVGAASTAPGVTLAVK